MTSHTDDVEPSWPDISQIITINQDQVAQTGGMFGLRDAALLESALARPRNAHAYGCVSAAELAYELLYGICRNHAFVDGNKRTALVAAQLFLIMNGFYFDHPDTDDLAAVIEGISAGEDRREEMIEVIEAHLISIEDVGIDEEDLVDLDGVEASSEEN